jgi:hypothetical protein
MAIARSTAGSLALLHQPHSGKHPYIIHFTFEIHAALIQPKTFDPNCTAG